MIRKLQATLLAKLVRTHRDEDGMVTFVFLIALVLFMVLGGLVFNAGKTVNRKIEVQNAADAVAYSSSLWVARGMNAMTAANHIIGELNALYVIHHALGGKYLDENTEANETNDLKWRNELMDFEYNATIVQNPTIRPLKPDQIKEDPVADYNSAIYLGKRRLKNFMTAWYGVHLAAAILEHGQYLPFAGPIIKAIAIAIQAAMVAMEAITIKEYLVLTAFEVIAQATKYPKMAIPTLVTVISWYERLLLVGIPIQAWRAADRLAERHHAEGYIRGGLPEIPSGLDDAIGALAQVAPVMPVVRMPEADGSLDESDGKGSTLERRSQMLRATYPWVVHWRKNIYDFLNDPVLGAGLLSGAEDDYIDWTNNYALQTSLWMRLDSRRTYKQALTVINHNIQSAGFGDRQEGDGEKARGVQLYVVRGLDQPNIDKSQELFNRGDRRQEAIEEAEKLFSHIGFAHKATFEIGAPAFYRQENPDGFAAFAQSMIYNANPQQAPASPRGGGGPQPEVGWDTLNFLRGPAVVEYPTNNSVGSQPLIQLNWQAKLTPVTPEKLIAGGLTLAPQDPELFDLLKRSAFATLPMSNH